MKKQKKKKNKKMAEITRLKLGPGVSVTVGRRHLDEIESL